MNTRNANLLKVFRSPLLKVLKTWMWKQDGAHLWALCSKLVAQSDSPLDRCSAKASSLGSCSRNWVYPTKKIGTFLKHLPNQNLYYGFTLSVACVGELPYGSWVGILILIVDTTYQFVNHGFIRNLHPF